jgi:hypothetical protein
MVIRLGIGARHPNWTFSIVMTGVFLFMYIALVIYGKMVAQRWQRENRVAAIAERRSRLRC